MGSGISAEVDSYLMRWDSAIQDLQLLCATQRQFIEGDRFAEKERPSSGYFNSNYMCNRSLQNTNVGFGDKNETSAMDESLRQRSSLVSFNKAQNVLSPIVKESHRRESGSINRSPSAAKPSRQQVMDLKRSRLDIFRSYLSSDNREEDGKGFSCTHFMTIAIVLSALLGGKKDDTNRRKKVKIEDIFFATQLPLHMLYAEAPYLPNMTDIIREFIDVDNRFKNQYSLEVQYFDIKPVLGEVERDNSPVGDRQVSIQMPEFRRALVHDIEDESDAIRIIYYDPRVLEQETTSGSVDLDSMDGLGESKSLLVSFFGSMTPFHRHENRSRQGTYAAVVDYRNVVEPMVTLAVGTIQGIELHEVSFNALFKAMSATAPFQRSRGYIRICKYASSETNEESKPNSSALNIPLFFSPELCSGKVLGTLQEGVDSSTVSYHISSHITAVAWAAHFLQGPRPCTHGHGNGLPVSNIIRRIRLSMDAYLHRDMRLNEVFEYAHLYLQKANLPISVTYHPISDSSNRWSNAPVTSVFDLESIMIEVKRSNSDPEDPRCIMIMQYNANIAHNAIGIADIPQWCILVGYDEESQIARFIDASPTRFSHTWMCRLDRIHEALVNHGFLIFWNSEFAKCIGSSGANGQKEISNSHNFSFLNTALLSALLQDFTPGGAKKGLKILPDPPRPTDQELAHLFQYPDLPMSIVTIALTITKLGRFMTCDDVVYLLPYDVSAFLISNPTITTLKIWIDETIQALGLANKVDSIVRTMDLVRDNQYSHCSLQDFRTLLGEFANSSSSAMIVSYNTDELSVLSNSKPYSSRAIVHHFDAEQSLVTLMDENPKRYWRYWTVTLNSLYSAMRGGKRNSSADRQNGVLVIYPLVDGNSRILPQMPFERKFSLSKLPVQKIFLQSPSPQFQALSLAFAQFDYYFSPEEIFYEAYLKTMTDQRRRGSQGFAWRDVDVSLHIVNKNMDPYFMSLVTKRFLESRHVTSVYLEVFDDINIEDLPEILSAASCPDADHILIIVYRKDIAHNINSKLSGTALIRGYDPSTETVSLFDAEFIEYSIDWRCTLDDLVEMGKLDAVGKSPYGFVKLINGGVKTKETKIVPAWTALNDRTHIDEGSRRGRETVTKFL